MQAGGVVATNELGQPQPRDAAVYRLPLSAVSSILYCTVYVPSTSSREQFADPPFANTHAQHRVTHASASH